VIFEKNAETRVGVLNGYTCTVRRSAGGDRRRARRRTHGPVRSQGVSASRLRLGDDDAQEQGRGDPLVIGTLAKNDDARSAHVALRRCETGLRVHTQRAARAPHVAGVAPAEGRRPTLRRDRPPHRRPDTFWAQAVRTALAKDADPLRVEHRAEMHQRTEARGRAVAEIMERFKAARAAGVSDTKLAALDRGEKRELSAVYKKHG